MAVAGEAGEVAHQVAAGLEGGEAGVDGLVPGEIAAVQEGDMELDILRVELGAFVGGADGLTDAQAGVPEGAEIKGQRFAEAVAGGFVDGEKKQVDVGIGEKFTASVASDGHQGDAGEGGKIAENLLVDGGGAGLELIEQGLL